MADETYEYEEEVFTLTDEDGNEIDFEFIGRLEVKGNSYVAFIPVEQQGEDEEYVILKVVTDENGEETLCTIEDDDEFNDASDAFEDAFFSEIDYDDAEGTEDKENK